MCNLVEEVMHFVSAKVRPVYIVNKFTLPPFIFRFTYNHKDSVRKTYTLWVTIAFRS